MNTPAVCVALPVYNARRYLAAAVSSILGQTFRDFELVAVDDGSTDDSLSILRSFAERDPRMRVISRPNTGLAGALNDAWRASAAPLVARMDADDIAFPQRFARQLAHLDLHPEIVALGSAIVFMDSDGQPVKGCPRPLTHEEIEPALLRGDGGSLIHPVMMIRRSALEAINGYRMDVPFVEDLDLYLRLALVGRMANLPEPLLYYRVHPQSMNFVRFAKRREVKLQVLAEAHRRRGLEFRPEQYETRPGTTWSDVAAHHRDWAVTALHYAGRRVAIRHALRACRLQPGSRAAWSCLGYALRAATKKVPDLPVPDWYRQN